MPSVFAPLVGVIAMTLYTLNTFFWAAPIVVLSLVKFLIPIQAVRKLIGAILNACATNWISVNRGIQLLTNSTKFEVSGLDQLRRKDWYLVISNHQSWVDIVVLQQILNRKIPFLKFFLKKELIWVPVLGLAWWALDFPFMRRHSKSYLKKNPHKKGKDLETTRKACEKFKDNPVSIMNFVEGTRYTPAKHQKQKSPFNGLLKPKAGGAGFVMSAMGNQLHKILDITIAYPDGIPTFWQFVCGQVRCVKVEINIHDIDEQLIGNYVDDPEYRKRFQGWLNARWQEKQQMLLKYKPETGQQ